MHIKVVNSEQSIFREVNIFIDVVEHLDKHIIDADSTHTAATRGDIAVAYGFMLFTLTTPKMYKVTIKHSHKDEYCRKPVVDNRRALGDWLVYAKARFEIGNVDIRIDSYQYTLDIFVLDDATVYVDEKEYMLPVTISGGTNAD